MDYQKNPTLIENDSFKVIDSEVKEHSFSRLEYELVRRLIHSTGDFDFLENTKISAKAIDAAVDEINKGTTFVCDVQMVTAGISKPLMKKFNCDCVTYVSDPEVMEQAAEAGITRSIMGMRKAIKIHPTGIYAIGNAPTALLELIRLIKEEGARPTLIIGVPVGFVNAAESKNLLAGLEEVPGIACLGRKGGSSLAVAACNALLHITNKTYENGGMNPFVKFD
jgi:precorrin-8X/cobalt-precorrin-8 methylmutase